MRILCVWMWRSPFSSTNNNTATETANSKQQTVNINKERIRYKSAGLNISRYGWWKNPTTHLVGKDYYFGFVIPNSSSINGKNYPDQKPGERGCQKNRDGEREANNCIFISKTWKKKFSKKVKLY